MLQLRLTTGLALVACAAIAAAQSANTPSLQINKDNRTISISASDHAEADPDVADINIGFTVYGATLQAAYKTASDSSNGIMKVLLGAGAKSSDIQSQSQRVSRLSDPEIKQQKGQRYSVEQSWIVSVDPKNAAIVLDAAIQAGADQSGQITWRMKNSIALDSEAIRRATERANANAAEMAKALGVKLGHPLYATNTVQSNMISPVYRNYSAAAMAGQAAPAPLVIESQRVQRTATVQIIYAIE